MFNRESFVREFEDSGSVILRDVLSADFIQQARDQVDAAMVLEAQYHGTRDHKDVGMVLLCALYGGAFWTLFDNPDVIEPFNAILGDGCIVYAYTSSCMPPGASNYSGRIHVDCPRIIPGYITNMGATILLDEFTENNGATWYLPRSHTSPTEPDEASFYRQARRVIAPAGSAWFFNARTWHAGGANASPRWRRALTINMCRPWMKQRLDIPRALQHLDTRALSATARQKLGFDARVPANYDEYYAPADRRLFKQKTE